MQIITVLSRTDKGIVVEPGDRVSLLYTTGKTRTELLNSAGRDYIQRNPDQPRSEVFEKAE